MVEEEEKEEELEELSHLLNRKVSQHMRTKVLLLNERTTVSEAAAHMQRKNLDEVVVIDDLGRPVGLVTDEDILRKVGEAYAKPSTTKIEDIMTFPLATIQHDATVRSALELMKSRRIRKVAVTSDYGGIVGMIFRGHIADLIRGTTSKSKPAVSRLSGVLWNLGSVLQFAGVLILIPAILSTGLGDFEVSTGVFLTSTLLLISGFLLNSYGNRQPLDLRGMAILVFSSFVVLVLFGAIPYIYLSPYDAPGTAELLSSSIFSSAAGFTTAGITIFETADDLPQSLTFYRSFSQFVGGLSFIYLIMTAFYPERSLHAISGFISGQTPRLRELFGTITIVFAMYTVIMAVLFFYFGSEDVIDNFSLAMSTLSTGGLVPDSQIFSEIGIGGEFVIIAGMILGSLPFAFHYGLIRTKFLSVKLNREVLVFFGILGAGVVLFGLVSQESILDEAFTAIATSTTAGFQIVDMGNLEMPPKLVLTILMLIGGCGFSTAGGFKVSRLIDIVSMRKMFSKKHWDEAASEKKNNFVSIIVVLSLYPTVPLLGALYFSEQGYDFYESYFETIGAITTAGLGSGILGAGLDPEGKIVASFLMILGRLEIIIVIFMFVPKFVREKKQKQ